jgi:hypothetical protein
MIASMLMPNVGAERILANAGALTLEMVCGHVSGADQIDIQNIDLTLLDQQMH